MAKDTVAPTSPTAQEIASAPVATLGMLRADAEQLTAMLIILEHVASPNRELGHDLEEQELEMTARIVLSKLVVQMSRDLAAGLERLDQHCVNRHQPGAA